MVEAITGRWKESLMVQSNQNRTLLPALPLRVSRLFFWRQMPLSGKHQKVVVWLVLFSVSVSVQESVGVGAQESVVGVENLLLLGPRRHQTGGECAP
jgi:hypothetical protein